MRYTIDYHTEEYLRNLQEQKFIGMGKTINEAVEDCKKRYSCYYAETYDWATVAVKFLDSLQLPFADKSAAKGFMYSIVIYFDVTDFRNTHDWRAYKDCFGILS